LARIAVRLTNIVRIAEGAFIFVALALFTRQIQFLFLGGGEILTEDAKESLRLLFAPIYLITMLGLLPRFRLVLRVVRENLYLMAPLALAWMSTLWSIAPDITLRRCVALLFTYLFGIYISVLYDLQQQIRILAIVYGVAMAASVAVVLLFPDIGISDLNGGSWRGVFVQKNELGGAALMGILVFHLVDVESAWLRVLRWLGLAVAFVLLVLSVSRTPLFILACLTPVALSVRRLQINRRTGAMFTMMIVGIVCVLAAAAAMYLPDVLEALGRDATLSGRTELWSMAQDAIADHPWLGYGYGAFWEEPYGPSQTIWDVIGWPAPSAHNGVLDLWIGLGIGGPIAVLVSICVILRDSVALLGRRKTLDAQWPLLLTLMIVGLNFDESGFIDQNDISTVLYIMAALCARGSDGLAAPAPVRLHDVDEPLFAPPDPEEAATC
jgi:exopolysaccharide production protein ExoQ